MKKVVLTISLDETLMLLLLAPGIAPRAPEGLQAMRYRGEIGRSHTFCVNLPAVCIGLIVEVKIAILTVKSCLA